MSARHAMQTRGAAVTKAPLAEKQLCDVRVEPALQLEPADALHRVHPRRRAGHRWRRLDLDDRRFAKGIHEHFGKQPLDRPSVAIELVAPVLDDPVGILQSVQL
jgi:hypothetical protein